MTFLLLWPNNVCNPDFRTRTAALGPDVGRGASLGPGRGRVRGPGPARLGGGLYPFPRCGGCPLWALDDHIVLEGPRGHSPLVTPIRNVRGLPGVHRDPLRG